MDAWNRFKAQLSETDWERDQRWKATMGAEGEVNVLPFRPNGKSRDQVRYEFLRWLCQRGDLRSAKSVASLTDRDFDRLCLMAMRRYENA